jgi:hypothetical protein
MGRATAVPSGVGLVTYGAVTVVVYDVDDSDSDPIVVSECHRSVVVSLMVEDEATVRVVGTIEVVLVTVNVRIVLVLGEMLLTEEVDGGVDEDRLEVVGVVAMDDAVLVVVVVTITELVLLVDKEVDLTDEVLGAVVVVLTETVLDTRHEQADEILEGLPEHCDTYVGRPVDCV